MNDKVKPLQALIESTVTTCVYRVGKATGHLYVKVWTPVQCPHTIPIILLHDSLGCVALWRDFPEQLATASGRQVIAYDRTGFGQSSDAPGKIAPSFIEDEVHTNFDRVCQRLNIDHFMVLGHSVGGSMACAIAANYPERCRALVVESSITAIEAQTLEGLRKAKAWFSRADNMEKLAKYHRHKARWVLTSWVETWLSEDFRHWCLDQTLAQVQTPVLVLYGTEDDYGSVQQAERYCELISHCTLHILEQCGHVPHREQPEQVIQQIQAFLAHNG